LKRKIFFKDNVDEPERTIKSVEESQNEANKDKSNFYKDFGSYRKSLTGKWRFLVLCQLLLVWFLGYEAFTSADTVEAFKTPASAGSIVLARFLCAIVLHITLTDEI